MAARSPARSVASSARLTGPIAAGRIDSSRNPIAASTSASSGRPAASPQNDSGVPSLSQRATAMVYPTSPIWRSFREAKATERGSPSIFCPRLAENAARRWRSAAMQADRSVRGVISPLSERTCPVASVGSY